MFVNTRLQFTLQKIFISSWTLYYHPNHYVLPKILVKTYLFRWWYRVQEKMKKLPSVNWRGSEKHPKNAYTILVQSLARDCKVYTLVIGRSFRYVNCVKLCKFINIFNEGWIALLLKTMSTRRTFLIMPANLLRKF